MLPITSLDLAIPLPWFAQDVLRRCAESWALSRELGQAAAEACTYAAQLRYETTQILQRARQLQSVNAQHRAAGVRRRQTGL
jgi:hypothetical protein